MTETNCPPAIKYSRRILGVCFSIVLLAALGGLALLSYSIIFSETINLDAPITVELARQIGCPIPLPPTATHVRFAVDRHWGKSEVYVKFEANSKVCRKWATTVVTAYAKENKLPAPIVELQPITSPPATPSWGRLGPLPWFNIERIIDGATWSGGPGSPTIWINDDRGIFYCRLTNK